MAFFFLLASFLLSSSNQDALHAQESEADEVIEQTEEPDTEGELAEESSEVQTEAVDEELPDSENSPEEEEAEISEEESAPTSEEEIPEESTTQDAPAEEVEESTSEELVEEVPGEVAEEGETDEETDQEEDSDEIDVAQEEPEEIPEEDLQEDEQIEDATTEEPGGSAEEGESDEETEMAEEAEETEQVEGLEDELEGQPEEPVEEAEEEVSEVPDEEPLPESQIDPNEDKAIAAGELVKAKLDPLEQLEVDKIKLADIEIQGKVMGDAVSLEEAIETLIALSTSEQDIEKAVIRSVIKQKDKDIAKTVLENQPTKKLIEENANKGLLQTLEDKVGKTISQKRVKDSLALDLEDDQEFESILEAVVTDSLKQELIKKATQKSLKQIEQSSVEDDVTEIIKDDYNTIILEELVSEKLIKRQSAQDILISAVKLEEEDEEEELPETSVIKVTAKGPAGTIPIPLENLRFESGSMVMILDPIRKFTPGLYEIEIEINNPISGQKETIIQDLAWGVLAMNADKDRYMPGDDGEIHIGVLDDEGKPVCNADVALEITTPAGVLEVLEVVNTGNCNIFDPLNTKPDYSANYSFRQTGEYQLRLVATLVNGKSRTLRNTVIVTSRPDFIIRRTAATRLYPVGAAPMSIDIEFFQNFDGIISDVVPADFQISSVESGGDAIATKGQVIPSLDNETKLINWAVQASIGNKLSLRYFYDAPDVSPEFYTVGPLSSSGDLLEKRQWQIANDEPTLGADTDGDLLGHWKFNTGSGTTATDSTSNGNDGTLTNMEAGDWDTDVPANTNENPYSLTFDGTNEYVTVSDPAGGELDFGDTDDFTITGWVKRDLDINYDFDTLVAKRDGVTAGDTGYLVRLEDDAANNKVFFEVSDGTDEFSLTSTSSIVDSSGWTHFAIVFDEDTAANCEIYLDGTDDNASQSGTLGNVGSLANSLAVNFASESDGGQTIFGNLDDIRIYNRVLTASEISILAGGNAPGGVSANMDVWLKADAGVTNTGGVADDGEDGEAWTDQSGNGFVFDHNTTPAIGGTFPTWNDNHMHFNPAMSFTDDTDRLGVSSFDEWPTGDFYMTLVYQRDAGSGSEYPVSYSESTSVSDNYIRSNSGSSWAFRFANGNTGTSAIDGDDGVPHIFTARRTGSSISLLFDGEQIGTSTNSGTPPTGGCIILAEDFDSNCGSFTASEAFNGDIGEFVMYDAYPTATNQSKIDSYLAIKYGITLDQSGASGGTDYLDSAGNTIWAEDTSDTYEYEIIGIGQDDESGLDQTSAEHPETDTILKVSEATSQDDLDFLTIAHDNGDRVWTTTGAPATYQILDRVWQAQEINDIGTVDLEFDTDDKEWLVPALLSGSTFYFVYDSDNDGDLSDETPVAMVDNGTGGDDTTSDDKWTTQLNFPGGGDGRIEFTIATPTGTQNYPVGISQDLRLWLRADGTSVTNTGDGTDGTVWTDLGPYQYVLDHNTTPAINGTFPTWNDNEINDNPAVSFSDDTDRLGVSDFYDWPEGDFYITFAYSRDAGAGTEYVSSFSTSSSVSDNYIRMNSGTSWTAEYANGTTSTSVVNADDGFAHIFALRRTGSSVTLIYDGEEIGSSSNSSTPSNGGCFVLAEDFDAYCANFTASEAFNGDLAEYIIYDRYPSAAEQDKLNSYLSIKYGAPIDQSAASGGTDYVNSVGDVIWAEDTSDTFEYGIMGIGQDDTSGLDQTKSKAELSEAILQVSEATSQDDLDFLLMAHNNGDRLWTTTDAPSGYQILQRQWQAQETFAIGGDQDIGTVDLEFDTRNAPWRAPALLSGSTYYFVYDSDNDGNLNDETIGGGGVIAMTDDGTGGDDTGSDDKWTTQVDFPEGGDGKVDFTIATLDGTQNYPAGVSTGLKIWLRADSTSVTNTGDGTDGTEWTDLGPYQYVFDHNTSPAIGGTFPTWTASTMNNNPALQFSDETDRLGHSDLYDYPTDDFFIATVIETPQVTTLEGIYTYGAGSDPDESYLWTNTLGALTAAYANNTLLTGDQIDDGHPHISTMHRTGDTISHLQDGGVQDSESNSSDSVKGGCLVFTEEMDSVCGGFSASQAFTGDIAEYIIYDAYPSATDQQKIHSYLSIKYGAPLDQSGGSGGQDYLDSAGNTIWAEDTSDTFEYGIAGIGQDDTSGLDQTDSQVQEDEAILRVSEATSQDNLDFLIWANNNGDRTWTSTGAPAGYEILSRQWEFQETNDVGTVDIEIDTRKNLWSLPKLLSGSTYFMVYDSDDDGSLTDETPVAMNDSGGSGDDTASDDKWTVQLDFPVAGTDGRTNFAIATLDGTKTSPGAVPTNLEFWFKADSGVTHSGDGTSATAWADSGPYDYTLDHNVTPALGGSFPTYNASKMNSNPAIEFDATDDRLGLDDVYQFPTTDAFISIVYQRSALSGLEGLFNYGPASLVQDTHIHINSTSGIRTSFSDNPLISSGIDPDNGVARIITARRSVPTAGQVLDGLEIATESNSETIATGGCIVIGEEVDSECGTFSAAQDFEGDIAEIIIYDGYPNATEQQQINSYLALKYGITLDQSTPTDYITAQGTKMWNKDATGASTYNNDIAGIGQSDDTALTQTSSSSTNSDSIVTVFNPSDLENEEFMSWGNDDTSLLTSSTELPGGLPANAEVRLAREWLFQNDDGDGVGTVSITFDLSKQGVISETAPAGDYALLIDTDGDFSNATVHTTGASKGSPTITFTTASISDGDYVSLAGPTAPAPGGEQTNLTLWLKSDTGVYTDTACTSAASNGNSVACWEDQSVNGYDVTEASGNPSYDTSGAQANFNYNSFLDFDGVKLANSSAVLASGDDGTAFAVARNTSLVGSDAVLAFASGNPLLGTSGTDMYILDDAGHTGGFTLSSGTSYVMDWSWTQGVNATVGLNNNRTTSAGNIVSNIPAGINIGNDAGFSDDWFGDIAEVILYNAELSAGQIQEINSYLAFKYGITLDQSTATDYLASDGTTEMWNKDATNASTYNNDIAGIGRDDHSALSQTQSRSINTDSIIDVSSPSDLENLEFFSWGNDDVATTLSSTEVPGGLPGNASIRLAREWLAQNDDGDGVGTVTIAFDLDDQSILDSTGTAGDYALLIDADGDFSNATVHTTGANFNGNEIEFTGATIADGNYITLAGPEGPGPAGVKANLVLWLDASTGVYTDTGCTSAASNGNAIACWEDQSIGGFDVTASSNQPVLDSAGTSDTFNYKSFLTFTADDLTNSGTLLQGGDDGTFFAVARNTGLSGFDSILTFGSDNPQLGTSGTVVNLYDSGSLNHTTTMSTDTTYLFEWNWDQGVDANVGLNGDRVNGADRVAGISSTFGIGGDNGSSEDWPGDIAEVIGYSVDLSDNDIQKINSYLALKYGVTLDQSDASGGTDYLDSAGNTIWAEDTTDTYEYGIAGIGQDDDSGVDHTQSKSSDANRILRVADATSQDNLDFLIWADNDGAANWTTSGAPADYQILTRRWQAQETNDMGTVDLEFDVEDADFDIPGLGAGSVYYFISDTDNDGDLTDETPVAMNDSGSSGDDTGSDDKWTAQLNFPAGDTRVDFAIAQEEPPAPGGASSSLVLWLDGNQDTYSDDACTTPATNGNDVGCWGDNSGNFYDLIRVDAQAHIKPHLDNTDGPTFNYNSFLDFPDGRALENTTALLGSSSDGTAFAVALNDDQISTDAIISFGTNDQPILGTSGTDLAISDGTNGLFTGGFTLSLSTPYLMDWSWTQSSNATVGLNANRASKGSDHVTSVGTETNIGNDNNFAFDWIGDIAEVIVYSDELGSTDIQKVHSYLALKYGITIDQTSATDYLASDGTTEMWNKDATNASTYNNDIAGIGRDDDSNLSQTQTRSINTDSIIDVSAASDLDDLEFFVWGNDDGSTSVKSSEVPGGLPGNADSRLTREWLVHHTGDLGTITIAFDLDDQTALDNTGTAGDYALLIDTDGNFSNATVHTTGANFNGNEIEFTGATIADGNYVSLAGPQRPYPGGIPTNLQIWLKADAQVYTDTGCSSTASDGNSLGCWGDNSLNDRYLEQASATNQPTYVADGMNNNPTIDFAGGSTNEDFFSRAAVDLEDIIDNDAYHSFAAFEVDTITYSSATNAYQGDTIIGDVGGYYSMSFTTNGGNTIKQYNWDGDEDVTAHSVSLNEPYIFGMAHGGGNITSTLDGSAEQSTASGNTTVLTGDIRVGKGFSSQGFDGEIAEVISYDVELSSTDQRKVESYLAYKYGVTIDQTVATDYLASDGTTEMWNKDATGASTYNNDIAGIGKDAASGLNQTTSRSENSDGILEISNASDLEDLEFMSWGNDNASVDLKSTEIPAAGMPANATHRIAREWLLQNDDGDGVGTVTVTFDLANQGALRNSGSASDYALLIDTDGNFTNATIHTTGAALNSAEISFTTATIADGSYLALAGPEAFGPGGIHSSLELWFKGDAGLTNTGNATDATAWTDQSPSGIVLDHNTTPAIGGTFPTYYTSLINFNPGIDFDDDTDRLGVDSLQNIPTDDVFITLVYSRDDYSTDSESIFGYATDQQPNGNGLLMSPRGSGVFSTYIDDNLLDSADVGADDGIPHIGTLRRSGSTHQGIFDGTEVASETNSSTMTKGGCFILGEDQDSVCGGFVATDAFEGELTEFAAYSDDLTATEQDQVHSYFAIKYGITLDQSGTGGIEYLDSAGSTIWAEDTSDTFENDIAGIGQDDDSTLDQTQSKSVESDAILRVADATSQDDLDFLIWSNNNGAATWTPTGAPTGYKLLTRQWQAQESNDIGTVDLEFDVADVDFDIPALELGTDYYFVYDSDDDGSLSDETPTAMNDGGSSGDDTSSDNKWTGQVNFTNASPIDFTIATEADVPTVDTITLAEAGVNDDANLSLTMTPATGKDIIVWKDGGSSISVLNMPFEANSGSESSSTLDYSDDGNDSSSFAGSPTWSATSGMDGHGAYEFDGSADYIEVADDTSLDLSSSATVMAWINLDSISGGHMILSKGQCTVSGQSYYLNVVDDKLRWLWDNDSTCTVVSYEESDSAVISANTWHHVAAVHSTTGVTLYVDGVAVASSLVAGSYSSIFNSTEELRIGVHQASASLSSYWDGHLDEVYIFDRELTAGQISAYYSSTAPRVLDMPFEPHAGDESTDTLDDSGNGNDGTVNGATFSSTGGYQSSAGYDFDGTNDYIEVSDDSSLDLSSTAAVSAWINADGVSGTQEILTKYWCTGNLAAYTFSLSDDKLQWYWDADGDCSGTASLERTDSAVISQDTWHHVVAVHTASDVTLYVDGSAVSSSLVSGSYSSIFNSSQPLRIGTVREAGGGFTFHFDGQIDEVEMFDYALTAGQVSDLYQAGAADHVIDSEETSTGDTWQGCITPNNGTSDGTETCSNTITITDGPAGVGKNSKLWFKGDAGVTNTGNGTDATVWTDQSGNNIALDHGTTPSIGGTFPTYYSSLVNFNPGLDFDDLTDRIGESSLTSIPTDDMFVSVVYQRDDYSTDTENVFSYGTSAQTNANAIMIAPRGTGVFSTYIDDNFLDSADIGADDGIPHIGTLRRSGSTVQNIFDGLQVATESNSSTLTTGGCLVIGEDQDSVCGTFQTENAFEGNIQEIVAYSDDLTSAEQAKINSYFALKYGITLDQSGTGGIEYLDSAGNTIWAEDTSNTYENDIAGIGQDDTSSLDQTQSQSENADAILRVADAASQDDLDFLTWSNNDGAATWTATGAPSGYEILSRQWQGQEINDMGQVDLEFDVEDVDFDVPAADGSTYYFVYDSDNDGDLSDETPTAMNDGGVSGDDTGSDDKWTTQLDFVNTGDGKIDFTLAHELALGTAPGGVGSNVHLWLRADSSSVTQSGDGTAATAWTDLSNSSHLFDRTTSGVGGSDPTWRSSVVNGNPVVDFSNGTGTERLALQGFNDMPTGNFFIATAYHRPNGSNDETPWAYGYLENILILENTNAYDGYYDGNFWGYWGSNAQDEHPHIFTLHRTSSTITGVKDGLDVGTDSNGTSAATGQCFVLGEYINNGAGADCSNLNSALDFEGDLAEMIIYDTNLGATDATKVNSYFAIKYAIPLDQTDASGGTSYLDSDGNTIWAEDTSDTFEYDIYGIGQDDTSGLDQTSITSTEETNILKISEATSQDDLDFLTWAHNNGDRLWTSTDAPAGYQILERKWQLQESNDIGTVDIELDVRDPEWMVPILLSGSSFYFVYDSDDDGSLSDETPIAMVDSGASGDDTASDDKWTTQLNPPAAGVDGKTEFTLATVDGTQNYPTGRADDLHLWLRADTNSVTHSGDGTAATAWTDISPYSFYFDRTISGVGGTDPTWHADRINSNPALGFLGDTDRLALLDYNDTPENDFWMATVYYRDTNNSDEAIWSYGYLENLLILENTNEYDGYYDGNFWGYFSSNVQDGQPHIATIRRSGSTISIVKDGEQVGTDGNSGSLDQGECFVLGEYINNGADLDCSNLNSALDFEGDIAEIIFYDAYPSLTDQHELDSYLALKYGITLSDDFDSDSTAREAVGSNQEGDYVASDGSTLMFDISANGSYVNDVAGIGQDDDSGLTQTKSRSGSTDSILEISSPSDQDNLEFMSWGNDDGSTSILSTEIPGGVPANVEGRITREWLVQNDDGDGVGTVTVTFDLADQSSVRNSGSAGDYALLIDADGDFSNATVHTTGASYGSNQITFTGATIADGDYISLAGPGPIGPADITDGLLLWLKADAGVTTSGSDVTDWVDQSINQHTASQSSTSLQPDLVSNNLNFNPTVQFDGSNDRLTISGGIYGTATYTDANVYIVQEFLGNPATASNVVFREDLSPAFVNIYIPWSSTVFWDAGNSAGDHRLSVAWGGSADVPYIWTLNYSTTSTADGNNQDISRNGLNIANDATASSFTGQGNTWQFGCYNGSFCNNSNFSEIIVYGANVIDSTENQKIESYLAVKYGITIDQSTGSGGTAYIDSAGNTIWAVDTSDTYENDIAGIGQDDASLLDQTQSQSQNSDGILRVADATSQDDLDFLTWSNNNGAASWTTTGAPSGYEILSRQWQGQEINDMGTVDLEFDLEDGDFDVPALEGGSVYYFVSDTDNDGSLSDETPVAMNDSGSSGDDTGSDDKWTAQLNFPGGTDSKVDFTVATQVANAAPTFTTDTAESWIQAYNGTATTDARASSSATFPTNEGTIINFTATGNDADSDNYYLIVCESAGVTANASAAPSCTGTQICVSSSTASDAAASCTEDTTGNSNETQDWYSYVCDHNASSICSSASDTSQGGSDDETNGPNAAGSPFHVNHRPTYTAGISAVDPGDTVTVTNSADADTDTQGSQDTVSLYVCSGEADQGGSSTNFDARAKTCTGGTLLCSQTGVNPASADATCNDTQDIVSVPTAHATDYTVRTFMVDNHDFISVSTSEVDFTVNDVAPVLTAYTTADSVDGTISAGGSDDLTREVAFTDDNGDNDPTLIDMVVFDVDTAEGDANDGTDACSADDNDCIRFDNESLASPANCTVSNRSTAGSGKTAQGTDNSLSVSCDFEVFFNFNETGNLEVSATVTDGTGDTNFADSNVNSDVAALLGIGVLESSISYGTVALGGTSLAPDRTTVQNFGNQIADYQVSGTDMTSGGDTIAAAQQKWDYNTLDFNWDTSPTAYALLNTPSGGAESGGCVNESLAVRADAASGTENEEIFWKIRIPATQEAGSYSGTNTFTAAADGTCTGTSH